MKREIRERKHLWAVIGVLSLTAACFAADVQMSIEPNLISLLDRAVLKVEFIDTKGDAVDIPQIDGLDIRYQGQSSETRIINLKSTSKAVHNYVVTPSRTGDFTIGPITAKFNGGSKELTAHLRVIRKADDQEAQALSELMFSRLSISRSDPFVQEPFNLELKIFIREGIQIDGNFSMVGGLPESGIDGEPAWTVSDRTRIERNGSIFTVYTLNTTVKTLTSGRFHFEPQVQVNMIVPRQKRRSYGFDDPFFGDFFGRQERRPFILDCNPLDIDVRPVPLEGRPAGFTGGVGVFDFNVDASPREVKAGEPVTLKMAISGNGNLSKITPPDLQDVANFKRYEARAIPSDRPDEVCFEQVIIPQTDSITNIPPVSFSYFNTRTADFRTITRGPFPITVKPAPLQAATVITAQPGGRPETRILGHDIVYLKPRPKAWILETEIHWYRSTGFRMVLVLPILLLLGTAVLTARRNALAGNAALARRHRAPKAARAQIRRAEQALRAGDASAFYEALWLALTEYFANRLNLAPGEITGPVVTGRLPGDNGKVAALFDEIEQRRYGILPGETGTEDSMRLLLNRLTNTLKQCERMKL